MNTLVGIRKVRLKKELNNIECSTIVPVQPFGYNMLLGKLLNPCGSEKIRKDWKDRYGDELVGMTTTSLYGTHSMYNSIPMWKKVGSSNGKIIIKPVMTIISFGTIGLRRITR